MRGLRTPLLLLSLALLAVLGLINAAVDEPVVWSSQATAQTPAPPSRAHDLATAFEKVAETIAPSVVTIRSVKDLSDDVPARRGPDLPRFFFGSPFGQSPFDGMFGEDLFERLEPYRSPGRFMRQGQGSGVIVSRDGYILTNSHVVSDADEVTVILNDDRRYTAEVVGTDAQTDLAVVKIDADGLRAATLGDSDALRIGQWVVAAGNPFGLSSTITAGIVSATGRSRVGVADYEDFIQTDAAINPGNSGGPLVDLDGAVVGINTAIFSRTGANSGIGFAIPIGMARSVMDELIADGRVVRGYLGVVIQDLSEGMARSFGYDRTDGALVSEVTDDSPAARAGLEPGDIITHLDGDRVTSIDRLKLAIAEIDPGTTSELRIFRDGRRKTVSVEIGELPSASVPPATKESSDLNIGMTVETLTPSFARGFGLDDALAGVVVTSVEPLGPAARAGLRSRDVITHVHDTAIENADDFRRELRRHDLRDGVRLVVRSGSTRRFVFLQLAS